VLANSQTYKIDLHFGGLFDPTLVSKTCITFPKTLNDNNLRTGPSWIYIKGFSISSRVLYDGNLTTPV